MQAFQGLEVLRYIFSDGSVRAAAGFDRFDTVSGESGVAGEELGVFACEDVVRDGGDGVLRAQGFAEFEHESRFARAYRARGQDHVRLQFIGSSAHNPDREWCLEATRQKP